MNILILGSSSTIGNSIAKRFSKNNKLTLISLESSKVTKLKKECLLLGSVKVDIIECDLSSDFDIDKLKINNIDIIFNVASSCSSLRDNDLDPQKYKYHTLIDLLMPIKILDNILSDRAKYESQSKLCYVFINSIVSKINSPNFLVYSSYKTLQQQYLKRFERKFQNTFNFINVIVGTQIDRGIETKKTESLSKRIELAINNNEKEFIFGSEGKLVYYLNNISPLISKSLIYFKRYFFDKNK